MITAANLIGADDLMKTVYLQIRERARQIVSRHPTPAFYIDHAPANRLSREIFETDSLVRKLHSLASELLRDDFGHGMKHSTRVALDAGALIKIECEPLHDDQDLVKRKIIITQCAALLHDIKRNRENHAVRGADHAKKILKDLPFTLEEAGEICQAIRHHEAFKEDDPANVRADHTLVSNCLYDADKFRWGPDNFTDTVWAMVIHFKAPLSTFIDRYPKGMAKIASIKKTFRTPTGREYGPQFIDIGLSVGAELLDVIKTDFVNRQ
ncbi:MAG: HD domain-containing protein [Desulfobacterales bacterium]|nr:HD domain-containing protein [Desulfobacterales bacterium]